MSNKWPQEYHLAWLAAHPHRTIEWLRKKSQDGFDIHHIDGNHANNAPENLVLIEHTDHIALHGMGGHLGRLCKRKAPVKVSAPRNDILSVRERKALRHARILREVNGSG